MKTTIWGLPVRIFHIIFGISIFAAFILEDEELLNFHTAFGAVVLIMSVFRIIYGIFGPEYARFSDFPIGFSNIKNMIFDFRNAHKKYLGHNPLAALVMLCIIILAFIVGVSGLLTLASEHPDAINIIKIGKNEAIKEFHEVAARILMGLVIIHLIGIVVDVIIMKKKTSLFSIFTGKKQAEGIESKNNFLHWLITIIFIILSVIAYFVHVSNTSINKKEGKGDNKELQHEDKD